MLKDPLADSREERQQRAIEMLRAEEPALAARLERCAAARVGRRRDRWPWTCRSAGCQWCGPRLAARWWRGLEHWTLSSACCASLMLIIGFPFAEPVERARRLRRGLRDVRDRAAQDDPRWRGVSLAGVVDPNGRALVLVRHPGLWRDAVAARLARRWPELEAKEVGAVRPSAGLPAELAARLGQRRRGMEPLRIVVMPQRPTSQALITPPEPEREPMPFVIG